GLGCVRALHLATAAVAMVTTVVAVMVTVAAMAVAMAVATVAMVMAVTVVASPAKFPQPRGRQKTMTLPSQQPGMKREKQRGFKGRLMTAVRVRVRWITGERRGGVLRKGWRPVHGRRGRRNSVCGASFIIVQIA
ncbi:MAG: hypothetical protein WHU94_13425, partial [Thermogemmata sp.]